MKVMLDNLGLVDFALGEVNSVLYMCDSKWCFLGVFKILINGVINGAHETFWFGLVKMTLWLVHAKL